MSTQGVKSKYLYLSGLQKGKYQFKLTVEDAKGQTDSKIVSIVVKAGMIYSRISIDKCPIERGKDQHILFVCREY